MAAQTTFKSPAPMSLVYHSAALSHVGRVRALNEDRLLDRPTDGLWVIADGMGGLSAGDKAADSLISALATVASGASGYARLTDLKREVRSVNAALFSGDDGAVRPGGMGATFVALLIHEQHYACVWAGDSRAYLLRNGVLQRLSHDHSVVQDLIDAGLVAEADRRRHPSAHLVTRAVGTAPMVVLDQRFAAVMPGDVFLLCSDGLTTCLDDAEIGAVLANASLERAAAELVQAALDKGAPDNVTVLTVSAIEA